MFYVQTEDNGSTETKPKTRGEPDPGQNLKCSWVLNLWAHLALMSPVILGLFSSDQLIRLNQQTDPKNSQSE